MVRVLVVDDLPDVRLAFRRMLENSGYDVGEAADGVGALEYVAKNRVEVVLTDLYMPGMDGLGLIQALRRSERPPRIILMSGMASLGDASMNAASVAGADVVLQKPVNRERLINAIRGVSVHSERGALINRPSA